jgi:hypothetical protein
LIYKNFFKDNALKNDKYGVEISFLTSISSTFHNRLDNREINQIDNPLNLIFNPKVGYRFNRNFTLSGINRFGYYIDYSQKTKDVVHRFAAEFIVEGVMTF